PDASLLGFSADGESVIVSVASEDKQSAVIAWDPATGKKTTSIRCYRVLELSSDSRMLAYTKKDEPDVHIWNMAAGKQVCTMVIPADQRQGIISSEMVAFAPNRKSLALGLGINGQQAEVTLWEIPTGKQIRSFKDSRARGRSLVFSPD